MSENKGYLLIKDQRIPVHVVQEQRSGLRVSLGASKVNIRIPKTLFLQKNSQQQFLKIAKEWLENLYDKKPDAFNRYKGKKQYKDQDSWVIGGEKFILLIKEGDIAGGTIKLKTLGNEKALEMKLQPGLHEEDKQKLIRKLLIKFSQNYFRPFFHHIVSEINDKYFKKEISSVRLKYNVSNWGSCSTGKNLNFSVRLLFAPIEVIRYVVIHELAHLMEMNHSDRFWDIVEKVDPNYRYHEKVLKDHGSTFDF